MQLKAILGQVALVGAGVGLIFQSFGKDTAGDLIRQCSSGLSPETLEICKAAAKETAKASREIYQQGLAALAMLGGYLNLFANAKGKSDIAAKKEIEAKLQQERKLP